MRYTQVEAKIIDYCQQNANNIYDDSISTLAEKVYTTPSTISKLTRKMGYNSFIEFKIDCQMKFGITQSKLNVDEFVINYSNKFTQSLEKIDLTQILKVKEQLMNSEDIILFGIGSSAGAAKYLKNNLLRLNMRTLQENNFYSNSMQLHARNNYKVALVIFSHSGETREIIQSLEDVNIDSFEIILVTSKPDSTLGRIANDIISYSIETDDKSPFSNWSYTIQISICDILLNELTRDITPNIKLNSQ